MGVSAVKGAKVDDSTFLAHLKDYAKVMGMSMAEVIRKQAGLFCVDMIGFTRPFNSPGDGKSSESKQKGKDNVKKSVYHIFQPIDKATPSQIASIGRLDVFKMWEKRNGGGGAKGRKVRWSQFQQKYGGGKSMAFVSSGDQTMLGQIHNSLRQDNGKGSLTPTARHSKQPFAIVERDKDIAAYIKKKEKDVGLLKSGYWFAAEKIKSNVRSPAWVKLSQGAVNAIGIDKTNVPQKPEVTVGNAKGGRGTFDSLFRSAVNRRAYAMRAEMAAKLNKDKISLWSATAQGKTSGTYHLFT